MRIYSFLFSFYIGVSLINNIVFVSGERQSDSIIHIHVSTLFQILFPFGLLQNIEQSSLCYIVAPRWLSILDTVVHICGEGNGSPLQYSSLENHMDRGAWWAAVHGVTKSRT